jgi:hypothetical protein
MQALIGNVEWAPLVVGWHWPQFSLLAKSCGRFMIIRGYDLVVSVASAMGVVIVGERGDVLAGAADIDLQISQPNPSALCCWEGR